LVQLFAFCLYCCDAEASLAPVISNCAGCVTVA
jgi:hypothetical protein